MDFFENLKNVERVIVYTDGACSGNPGAGGWGAFFRAGTLDRDACGGEAITTNNRMELTACIKALEVLPPEIPVTLRTDSRYVKDGISSWLKNWRRNGWKTAAGAPVKNADLWRALEALTHGRDLTWEWVAGHSGDFGNDRADALAKQGVAKAKLMA